MGRRASIIIDAGEYREKRIKALERLAAEVAAEVAETGKERVMPQMSASDRRAIHMFLKDSPSVTSISRGEGRDRRLVIGPKL
jgi:spoIIIJ-associated protein